MNCTHCGTALDGSSCHSCGLGSVASLPTNVKTVATPGARFGAYLIDLIPAVLAAVVIGWIPIIGAMIVGFILFWYWLLRDITGASLGKLALGLRVVKVSGQESGLKERLVRNIPIAIGPSLLMIPLAGYAIAPVVAGICIITEGIVLMSKSKRIGDMLAGSVVVSRKPLSH